MANISIYSNIKQTTGGGVMPLDLFLSDIKTGRWINDIIDYRNGKRAKATLPYVTISGEFTTRSVSGLKEHSGFITIDIDNVDAEETKSILCCDRHVHAAFTSVSGNGVAAIFKINPKKHSESFDGLSEYLFTKYGIVVDPSGRDVSRARFVSYDEDIFINEASAKFTQYPKPKPAALTKLPKTIYVQSDFDDIVNQITGRGLDIVPNYAEWLQIAFALADKFNEGGRHYFHLLSRVGSKYSPDKCDKQYTACLKAGRSGITIATFYYYCKQAGISTMSEKTRLIATTASQARKGGRKADDTVKLLKDIENIPAADSKEIVQQVFDNKIEISDDETNLISELEVWLRQNYEMKRNVITRKIENEGKPMETRDLNTIFVTAKKIFDNLTYEIMDRLINSNFTPDYNPLIAFFEQNKERESSGNIEKLCKSINTDMSDEYVKIFLTKWLCAIVQSIYTDISPLMLVLSGRLQNSGKTEFFRRLLPREIRQYYAESKLDAGKDDEILMTQKLIVMDDEMSGKSKKENAKMKALTSKKWFSLREPYGRGNVDLRRLAIMCGTSNDNQLLSDPTGNRRIIPISVIGTMDFELYNSIDKTDLFIEVYHLWKSGYTADLDREHIEFLNASTQDFEAVSIEKELIQRYFEPTNDDNGEFMTTTDIKVKLEQYTGQRVNLNKLGHELRNLGFEIVNGYVKDETHRRKGYKVRSVGQIANVF